MVKQYYYITTPIFYVNDAPHIGHAYTSVMCDIMARFKRLDGFEVMFLTGTDEHGQKVAKSAAAAGVEPQVFTDQVSQNFRDLTKELNLTNNDFIRTTEARHKKACQALWDTLFKKGEIYLGKYAGWYAVRDEAFYTEDELREGPGGKKFAIASGAECEWVEEPSYFFRLSAWQDRLLKFYDEHPEFVLPQSRKNEVVSFVKSGMRDLSVSRTALKWGVPVPNEAHHVMYVWLDALTNYITAVGYPDTTNPNYTAYWPADLHMVGKDILRFHAVYWPAFLLAAGLEPPKRIFAHGWWTNEGQKISKSVGNVINPYELIKEYGLDQTRYFLAREVPFGNDGDFSHEAMVRRINGELANDLGNLVQRSLSMIQKNCAAKVPNHGIFSEKDKALLKGAEDLLPALREDFNGQAFHKSLDRIWALVGEANRYVDEQAPWALKKTDPDRMATVLYTLAETIRIMALLLQPIMPLMMAKCLDQLSIATEQRSFQYVGQGYRLKSGTPLPAPQGLFPRIQEAVASLS